VKPDPAKEAENGRKVALFVLAGLFHAAAIARGVTGSPSASFDQAEAFLKEAAARGLDPRILGE
jgi:hypothetical protein